MWLRLRSDLRRSWVTLVALVLLTAIGGGTALSSFAGARRASSAMGRFVAYSLPDTGGFLFGSLSSPPVARGAAGYSLAPPPLMNEVVNLPEVAAYFREPSLYLTTNRSDPALGLQVVGAGDPDLWRTVDRPLVLTGRLPGPDQALSVGVDELAAREEHLHVGSRLELYAYTWQQMAGAGLNNASPELARQAPSGPRFRVTVAGIVRFPQDVNSVLSFEAAQRVPYLTRGTVYVVPTFLTLLAHNLGVPVQKLPDMNLVGVRLRHGAADWPRFSAAARRADGKQIFIPAAGNTANVFAAAASAQQGIRLEVAGFVAFGAVALIVTLLLVGQALARKVAAEAEEWAVLRSLGAGPGEVLVSLLARAALVGVVGGAIALAAAICASVLMPVGLAHQAEVSPGLQVDVLVLVPGFFALSAFLVLVVLIPASRVAYRPILAGSETPARSPSRLDEVLGGAPLPPQVAMGLRSWSRTGARSRALPLASGLFAAAVAVCAVAASLTFDQSLAHLLNSPRQQGWNWDVLVGNPNAVTNEEPVIGRELARDPFVESYSAIAILAGDRQGTAVIDGKTVSTVLAFAPIKGDVYPPLTLGHAPEAADQVVLGAKTLSELHKRVGEWVTLQGAPLPRFQVVGTMIVPSVGDIFTNGLGEGAWIDGTAVMAALQQRQRHGPSADGTGPGASGPPSTVFDLFAVRLAPGASKMQAIALLRRQFDGDVLQQVAAEDIVNLQSVDRLPVLLAGLVSLVGIVTVGNVLRISVHQRRRELALLKTIGFQRSQVAVTVATQAVMFSAVALVLGLPIGIGLGRWAWSLVTASLGSASPAQFPVSLLALIVPVTLAVSLCAAAGPGWSAARVAPATTIRRD